MSQAATPVPQSLYGYIQDGKIFAQTLEGTQQVGVSFHIYNDLVKQHNELLEITDEYKQILIDNKLIKIPLTQEQIMQQQAEQLKESQLLMARLAAKIDELTAIKEASNAEPDQFIPNSSRQEFQDAGVDERSISDSKNDTAKPRRSAKLHKPK